RVLEIVGEAEGRREFPSGLGVEIGIGAAGANRMMAKAEIGEALWIGAAGRQIAGDISLVVVDSVVPAQVEHRTEVAEAVDRVGGGAADREAVASEAEVASQGRIDAALGAAVRHQHRNVRLPAQEALLERVARSGHVQVHKGVEPRVQAAGEIHLKVAACDLAREGDVAAGVDRRVVIDSGEGEAGHERSGCQTAEYARDPEAYAAFVGPGDRRRRHDAAEDSDKSQSSAEAWLPA